MRTVVPAVVCWLLLMAGGQPGAALGGPPADVDLVAVAPNPSARGDAGEHLVIEVDSPTNLSGWTVTDGESVARFSGRVVRGRVVASTTPDAVPPFPNATVVALAGRLALANDGDEVVLRSPAGVVARVAYDDAPEGERYVRTDAGWTWREPGTTDLPVVVARDVPARLFALPDAPSVPLEAIGSATDRVLLAGYTFTSERVGRALCDAHRRGVRVRVLVEGEPVGGVVREQVAALDRLTACGVAVAVLGGPGDRYAVHHAKYAVVDDRALVVSENWKPAGTGGRSSRGWGVLLSSPAVAEALAGTFAADADFRDARPWPAVRSRVAVTDAPVANGSYPARFPPTDVVVDRVEVLLAPDNAGERLVEVLDGAERSVAVQQVAIGGVDGPFGNATVRAARRGVDTRVLLSRAWYVRADNRRLADRLNRRGRDAGLPLRARLVHPRSRFAKTHVKGAVVDGRLAVVGSLNWNAYAARENREVVVVLHDAEAAAYFGRIFLADWRGGTWRLPVGFGVSTAVAGVVASLAVGRAVAFGDGLAEAPADGQSAW